MRAVPPLETDNYIEIPKHVFPYNEEWLECSLHICLKEKGI